MQNKDTPHYVHFCIIQMIGLRSKAYPLRILPVRWYDKVFGHPNGRWLSDPMPGDYRIIAAFMHYSVAERWRKILSQLRLTQTSFVSKPTGRLITYNRCISLEETDRILQALKVAEDPDCIYTYQKEEESYMLWLNRQQHP